MPFSQKHFDMLSEMGIPLWVRRSHGHKEGHHSVTLAEANVERSAQPQALPATRWLICVESTQMTTAEKELLNAICKACRIANNERALITEPQITELTNISHEPRRVLCLAPTLWSSIQAVFASVEENIIIADELHLIASPSLADMLNDGASKAQLWSRIKYYAV